MRCLLVGNFGVGNLGDEALKEYFLTEFSDIHWLVVSASPQENNEVARLPSGIRSVLGFGWIKTLQTYRSVDAVVFGGGSLFTDTESVFACFLWWIHAMAACAFGKPIHFAFQGIGPFQTRAGEWFARSALRRAASISVRDTLSKKRCEMFKLDTKIVQSFDPVFSLFKNKNVLVSTKNVFVLIPRKNSGDKFTISAEKLLKSMAPIQVRIVSMHPDDASEKHICKNIADQFQGTIVSADSIDILLAVLADAKGVLSERYHGALAAMALGKEVEIISQQEGDKLSTLSGGIDGSLVHKGQQLLRDML